MTAQADLATAALAFERVGFGAEAVEYQAGWDLQRDVHADVVAGVRPDTVLLLEHRAVYTAGRSALSRSIVPFDGTPVVDVDRGGKITWHGPGQLVGYPIVRLPDPIDVVAHVRRIEAMIIDVCAELGVAAMQVRGPQRGLGAGRRRATGTQGRCDRDPRHTARDDARLRAQLRLRPHLVRPDRALRHPRRERHVAQSPNWGATSRSPK